MNASDIAGSGSLCAVLVDDDVRLEPLADDHLPALRAACAQDRDIWAIYPHSMLDDHFDAAIAGRRATPGVSFAALHRGTAIGITAYLRPDHANGKVEIGGTYIVPSLRGTDYNRRMKRLMIDHVFACGFQRIVFLVDERNQRSQGAVMKLGAQREGLLRRDRITWTGHVRNTCVFGLLREEWNP